VIDKQQQKSFLVRVWNTAVFWTWIFNGFRVASGILLVPLLLRYLSSEDLGMHYNFLYFTGFLLSFDAMFAVTVARAIGYALRGVTTLQAIGVATVPEGNLPPNTALLAQILGATKRLYRYLSLAIALLLGLGGTLLLFPSFPQTSHPTVAWTAWVVMIISACLELYTGYWLVFLRGLDQMVLSARLSSIIYGTKLFLSCLLLMTRFGLMAVPIAGLVTGVLQRIIARHFALRHLPAGAKFDSKPSESVLAALWPNAWRLGLILLSGNILMAGFGTIISRKLGLPANYRYGISQQIIYGICVSMAGVWTLVKWPKVSQLRATNDYAGLQRLLWPRIWLQLLTYAGLSLTFLLFGPAILKRIAPAKELMPAIWLILLAAWAFLDMHYIFWTTLISTQNRVPSLWAAVFTNMASLIMAALLVTFTDLGLGSFVLAPLLCGLALNFWFWPRVGARSIGTTWWKYMFSNPARERLLQVPVQPPSHPAEAASRPSSVK
jgi:hypothetical protein